MSNAALTARVAALEATVTSLQSDMAAQVVETDTFFLIWAGALIFLMQCGFATLSAGSIRQKNVKNILLKNVLDACMGALAWYFVGYGFAYNGPTDTNTNPFIGSGPSHFALSGVSDHKVDANGNPLHAFGKDWVSWYFQFAFAAAAATIVSGAVAERCQLGAYLIYTACITGFIYPVVVHWVWDGSGFLSAFNADAVMHGCIDFAGSGVVHMTGGWAAMVGAKILGPRLGRFEEPSAFEGHSTPLVIIGTFLLWFGWYGFNPGSTLAIHGYARDAARACVTTTLSAAAAGVLGLFIKRYMPVKMGGNGVYDIGHTCNSLLGGLVGITAGCSTVTPACSIVIGCVAAFVYHGASCTMRKLKIDDPLDAFAVHGACGLWGVLAVGLFCRKEYSYSASVTPDAGLFMPGTRGILFGTQVVTALIEISWVVTLSAILFGLLKAAGIFRVKHDEEVAGMDSSKHGGSAYPADKPVTV